LRQAYGFKDLTHPARAELLAWAGGIAVAASKDKDVVTALAEEMRQRRIIIPGISVLERLAAQACTEAEEALFAAVAKRLTPDTVMQLEALIGSGPRARQSGVSWLREPPGKAGAPAMCGLIDRLDAVRHVGLSAEICRRHRGKRARPEPASDGPHRTHAVHDRVDHRPRLAPDIDGRA
jgi:hypothetical protein